MKFKLPNKKTLEARQMAKAEKWAKQLPLSLKWVTYLSGHEWYIYRIDQALPDRTTNKQTITIKYCVAVLEIML
jgi:hypothetical protein